MTKTIPEIDDEMVARAYEAYRAAYSPTGHASEMIRAALTAALTPEPEIEVTEAMRQTGWKRMWDARGFLTTPEPTITDLYAVQEAYRAMRAKEAAPSGAKSAPQGVSAGAPEKATGGGGRFHRRANDDPNPLFGRTWCTHRRSTDPK